MHCRSSQISKTLFLSLILFPSCPAASSNSSAAPTASPSTHAPCAPHLITCKHFVLIAAPGSGKGTFSQHLVNKYGYMHICPGNIFRQEIRKQTLLGKKIRSIVERGEYVDKELVCSVISKHLTKALRSGKCFILDGFPRAKISFDFLHQFFEKHNLIKNICFVQLKSHDQTCIERIINRIICPSCSMVYNYKFAAPKQTNTCDICNTQLIPRTADTENIAKKRLSFFHTKIEPLLKIAEKFYDVLIIETEYSIRDLRNTYEKLVEGPQPTKNA